MNINIKNEYGKLKSVLMASIDNYKLHEPINMTQKYYYENNPPNIELLKQQHKKFIDTLKENNIDICFVENREDSPLQFNTRDVAFVIGSQLFVCNMKENIRKREPLALNNIVKEIDTQVNYIDDGVIEGGDIIVDNECIYTGISERTDNKGYEWLNKNMKHKYEIIPIKLKKNFLHLDVVFSIISEKHAMIYTPAIEEESLKNVDNKFELIDVDEKEQFNLATNVFVIGNKKIICDGNNVRANEKIKSNGFELMELDFSEVVKIGGSFRCSTCPLERE